jgi:hypothetical protein
MMKKLLLPLLFMLIALSSFGQYQSDSIQVRKALGTIYLQHGKRLRPNQLLDITYSNPDAYNEMKIAKSNYDAGAIFGFAGGFLIGWSIGGAIGGQDFDWTLAGVGAGLTAISIPFSVAFTRHAKKAVKIYNDGLKSVGYHPELRIGLNSNGVGLSMVF